MVFDGYFLCGQTYSLNEISEILQMSKTPVRDAIIRLSNEKRIDLLPSRGFRVHTISDEELQSRVHYAIAIEGYAVYRMALECKETGVVPPSAIKLQSLVHQMEDLDLNTVSFGEFTQLDRAFHLEIVNSVEMLNYHLGLADAPEIHLTHNPLSFSEILSYHQMIINAILAGDPDGAYAVIMNHGNAVYENYRAAVADNS